VLFAASKAAGYMSLQRPLDARIVSVGQEEARGIAKWVKQGAVKDR